MVGVTGLEPMASWSRTKRDTKLRHTPMTATILYNDMIKKSREKINYFYTLINQLNFCKRGGNDLPPLKIKSCYLVKILLTCIPFA